MINFKRPHIKPLLYWSVYCRLVLALGLSAIMWALVLGVTYLS